MPRIMNASECFLKPGERSLSPNLLGLSRDSVKALAVLNVKASLSPLHSFTTQEVGQQVSASSSQSRICSRKCLIRQQFGKPLELDTEIMLTRKKILVKKDRKTFICSQFRLVCTTHSFLSNILSGSPYSVELIK